MSKESALATATATAAPAPAPTAPPASPETPATASAPSDAARFAALAKKEAQIVKDRESFKREQEAFTAQRTRVEEVLKKAQQFEELKGKDQIAALKAVGFSETEIFNLFASLGNKSEPTAEEKAAKAAAEAAEAKIKAFEEEQAKKAIEAQKATDAKLISGLKSEISNYIQANQDKYEYSAYFGPQAEALAYEIIVEGLKASNGTDLIDFKEAIEMAESFYEEQDKEMSGLKKRQPVAPAPEPTQQRTRVVTQADPNYKQNPVITRTRTLSNDTGVRAGSTVPKNETREQKRERLIAQIKATGLRK